MPVDVNLIHVGPGFLTLDEGEVEALEIFATEDGGTLAYSRGVQMIEIAEEVGAIDWFVDGEEITFTVVCRELDAERLKVHFGHGDITTVAANVTDAGYEEFGFGGSYQVDEHTLTYRVPQRKNANLNLIINLHRVVSMTEGDLAFQKSGETGVPLTFRGLADLAQPIGQRLGTIRRETEEATG